MPAVYLRKTSYTWGVWTVFALGVSLCQTAAVPLGGSAAARVDDSSEERSPAAIARLQEQLEHPAQSLRASALLALATLGDPITVPTALSWLRSHDVQTRLDALAALRVLEERKAGVPVPILALLAEDEHPAVRREALHALPSGANPAARQMVASGLEDPDVTVRQAAIESIGRLRDPALLPALEPLLDDGDPATVLAALRALATLADPAVLPRLGPMALAPGGSQVTRQALATLGRLPGREPAALLARRLSLLGPDDAAFDATRAALRTSASAEPALLPLLDARTDFRTLRAVVGVLSEVGTEASVMALAALSGAPSAAATDALRALAALAKRGVSLEAGLVSLAIAAEDPSQTVRRAARAALEAHRKTQSAPNGR